MLQIFVGNKSDLEHKKGISFQMGKELADEYEKPFFETSAKLEKMVILI